MQNQEERNYIIIFCLLKRGLSKNLWTYFWTTIMTVVTLHVNIYDWHSSSIFNKKFLCSKLLICIFPPWYSVSLTTYLLFILNLPAGFTLLSSLAQCICWGGTSKNSSYFRSLRNNYYWTFHARKQRFYWTGARVFLLPCLF